MKDEPSSAIPASQNLLEEPESDKTAEEPGDEVDTLEN